MTPDLAPLIRRLANALPDTDPLARDALDFLQQNGINGKSAPSNDPWAAADAEIKRLRAELLTARHEAGAAMAERCAVCHDKDAAQCIEEAKGNPAIRGRKNAQYRIHTHFAAKFRGFGKEGKA